MTVLSLFGFFAFSFTIVGGIAGGVVGGTIGRYAGKKLRKKIKRKEPLTQEELYRIKIQCMIQLGKLQKNLLKHNLNKYRTLIEKVSWSFRCYILRFLLIEFFIFLQLIRKTNLIDHRGIY